MLFHCTYSGVTGEAVSTQEGYQTVLTEGGVPGETTASVHGPVGEGSPLQRDTAIIHGMIMTTDKDDGNDLIIVKGKVRL